MREREQSTLVSRIIRVGTITNSPLSNHLKEVRGLVIPISRKSIPDTRTGWCKIMLGVTEEDQRGGQCVWGRASKGRGMQP